MGWLSAQFAISLPDLYTNLIQMKPSKVNNNLVWFSLWTAAAKEAIQHMTCVATQHNSTVLIYGWLERFGVDEFHYLHDVCCSYTKSNILSKNNLHFADTETYRNTHTIII